MNALFSLWVKDELVQIGKALQDLVPNMGFYGSRGTAGSLSDNGVPATDIATLVGEPFPDNLVVTLSQLHFGLLCDRSNLDHMAALAKAGLPYIDIVWVSLYPLKETIDSGGDQPAVRKATDMGGVALLRSGAKGRRLVAGSLKTMWLIVRWLEAGRPNEEGFRTWLAWRAEARCEAYCQTSATHLHGIIQQNGGIPDLCPPLFGIGAMDADSF